MLSLQKIFNASSFHRLFLDGKVEVLLFSVTFGLFLYVIFGDPLVIAGWDFGLILFSLLVIVIIIRIPLKIGYRIIEKRNNEHFETAGNEIAENKLEKAEAALSKVELIDYQQDIKKVWQAMIETERSQYQDALELLNQAEETCSKWYLHAYSLGVAYRKLGKYEEALAKFNKAASMDTNYMVLKERGLTNRGLGDLKAAEDDLRRSVEAQKLLSNTYDLAGFLVDQNRWDEAESWVDEAFGLLDEHPHVEEKQEFKKSLYFLKGMVRYHKNPSGNIPEELLQARDMGLAEAGEFIRTVESGEDYQD